MAGKHKKLPFKIASEVVVDVVTFRDGGAEIVYAPALDVYGYGDNMKEAKASFAYCLHAFINYAVKQNTFGQTLKQLGWEVAGADQPYRVPTFVESIHKNEYLKDIVNHKNFRKSKQKVSLPL